MKLQLKNALRNEHLVISGPSSLRRILSRTFQLNIAGTGAFPPIYRGLSLRYSITDASPVLFVICRGGWAHWNEDLIILRANDLLFRPRIYLGGFDEQMVSRTAVKTRTGSKGTSVKNRRRSIKSKDEWKVRQRSSFTSGFVATIFDRRIAVAGGVRNFFAPLRQPTTEGKTTFRPFPRHCSTVYRFIAVFR